MSPATDPADLGALEAARELRARRLSARGLLAAVLARIEARNGGAPTFDGASDAVNAWARVYPEEAEAMARAAAERLPRQGGEPPRPGGAARARRRGRPAAVRRAGRPEGPLRGRRPARDGLQPDAREQRRVRGLRRVG